CSRGRVPASVPGCAPRGTAACREWPLRDAHVRVAARVHPRRAQHRFLLHSRGAPLHLWRPVAGMNFIDRLLAPLFVSWQLARDCGLRCLHCCTESAPGKKLGDELDEPEAMRLVADIVGNGVPYVMLCGGEPLVVPHFLAVAEALGRAGVALKIEAHRPRLDTHIPPPLAPFPLRSIQVSLDGDTQDVYAQQRLGASLTKAHAACRAARDASLPLEVTFAPTRLNLHEAAMVVARARALGAF